MELSRRENLLETIWGGSPERLVNQFEYLGMAFDPIFMHCSGWCDPNTVRQSDWGFWIQWPAGQMAPFPMHDDEHLLIKDVEAWADIVTAPDVHSYPESEWSAYQELVGQVDRADQFVTASVVTGVFEKLHYMMGMDAACINLLEEPEAMHELIDLIADWEIEVAKVQIDRIQPDALYHHDDFGTQVSTLMSPATFREFFVPAYKRIYGFYKDNGVELIVHHSDSFAQTLVPDFMDMGVDIWQGVLDTNDIPGMVERYGGQISFHGGLNNGKYDMPTTTREQVRAGLLDLIDATGVRYVIPALTAGGPETDTPWVYDLVTEEIDNLSKEIF